MSTTFSSVTHNGRAFPGLGHVLDGDKLACYLGKTFDGGKERIGSRGFATDWAGKVIGRYEITGRWKMPHSYLSDCMVSARIVLVGGAIFTGRGMGVGMLFRGKRAKS